MWGFMLYIYGLYAVRLMGHYSPSTYMNKPNTLPSTSEVGLLDSPTPPQLSRVVRFVNALKNGRLLSGVKRRLRPVIVAMGKSALRRPWIKRTVLAVLNRSPELKNRLYRLVWKDIALSPRAMRIYTALSTAIPTHSKGSE
jgi:hypothetical protein